MLLLAQLAFATAAYLGTQFGHRLAVDGGWVALLGLTQAMNPAANRPLVMSAIPPELQSQAFAPSCPSSTPGLGRVYRAGGATG